MEPKFEPTLPVEGGTRQAYQPPAETSLAEMPPSIAKGDASPHSGKVLLKVALILLAAALVGEVAILPFSWTLIKQMPNLQVPPNIPKGVFWTVVFAVQLVVDVVFSLISLAIGLGLGRMIGLGDPLLADVVASVPGGGARLRRALAMAAIIGLALGIAVTGLSITLSSVLPEPERAIEHPPAWEGFLASIGAGVREELWLRMGLLTLLAWAPAMALGKRRPGLIILWTANVLAALPFGAMHLPQASGLLGELTAGVVAYVLALNGIIALACGWLYWRYGISAAMMAHFGADIILHVIAPAL
jgi:hypothetical protein